MKHRKTAMRLRTALDNNNMIPQDLANKSGVSKASISQYINGSHKPSNISSGKMASVLDVDPMWLMGFDVPMNKEPSDIMDAFVSAAMVHEIVELFGQLNAEGQEKLISYAEDLVSSGRYKKHNISEVVEGA